MRGAVLAVSVAVVVGGAVWPTGNVGPAPTATPRPWGRPVYVQVDADARIEACEGLAPVIGTRPAPLVGCTPWQSCRPCEPGRVDAGQVFVLWPSVWRYRISAPDATPAPIQTAAPGPCVPSVVIVTATPTDTPRPTATMELTPTVPPSADVFVPVAIRRR